MNANKPSEELIREWNAAFYELEQSLDPFFCNITKNPDSITVEVFQRRSDLVPNLVHTEIIKLKEFAE